MSPPSAVGVVALFVLGDSSAMGNLWSISCRAGSLRYAVQSVHYCRKQAAMSAAGHTYKIPPPA